MEDEVRSADGGPKVSSSGELPLAARELVGKLVYVAYFYTRGDCVENTHRAIKFADYLLGLGIVPIIPHLNLLWHIVSPKPASFWYEYDYHMLRKCDACIVMDDSEVDSLGVQLEVQLCLANDIPVYRSDEV